MVTVEAHVLVIPHIPKQNKTRHEEHFIMETKGRPTLKSCISESNDMMKGSLRPTNPVTVQVVTWGIFYTDGAI